MKQVIFDCDNTFVKSGKDIDDGLTLLYLLGHSELQLKAVTLTYGNGSLEDVKSASQLFWQKFKLDIPRIEKNQGAYLANFVAKNPKQITIIATGALTNLAEAYKADANFFTNVKEIVIMGGTIKPLIINNKSVNELNFSADYQAAKSVLLSQTNLTVMTGHVSGQAFFPTEQITKLIAQVNYLFPLNTNQYVSSVISWLEATIHEWCHWNLKKFGWSGFCNWDMTTAVYLTSPSLFSDNQVYLSDTQFKLNEGEMICSFRSTSYQINLPQNITSVTNFNQNMIKTVAQGIYQVLKDC